MIHSKYSSVYMTFPKSLLHILAWRIPWTEEPGGLQPTGSQRVRHDLVTKSQQQQYQFYLNKTRKKENMILRKIIHRTNESAWKELK